MPVVLTDLQSDSLEPIFLSIIMLHFNWVNLDSLFSLQGELD